MPLLRDVEWRSKYDSDGADLVQEFYIPALSCAVRYNRTTGYFSAPVLTMAARGVEWIVHNHGHMRLIVGCALDQPEVDAIEKGASLLGTLESHYLRDPLAADGPTQASALELLAWMVANGFLEIKVGIPCSPDRRPDPGPVIFHEKAGVIEDSSGARIAFNGGVNETPTGWRGNWDSFHVYTDWSGGKEQEHVDAEEKSFARLWSGQSKRAIVIDVPEAVRLDLLRFLPHDGAPPKRVAEEQASTGVPAEGDSHDLSPETGQAMQSPPEDELRRLAWGIIQHAPAMSGGGERVGEATANVAPYPHQLRAFQRLYESWPPKLLIADEVGLGKTIEAGLLLRQAWLAGRAQRILVLAPKAILGQWQLELREKFNLNWPIYNGHELVWYPSPAVRGKNTRRVERSEWHREPFILTSSQLMRRADRSRDLLEDAEPWDLVVLDEAHHARRRGAGGVTQKGPNQLLKLMQALRGKTQGLVLMTATPMQVSPLEVWDLLELLGLPREWTPNAFTGFFDRAGSTNPTHEEFEYMVRLFQASEAHYGPVPVADVSRFLLDAGPLAARKVLDALRDQAVTQRRMLSAERRRAAIRIMQANTPAARLISRHTRELLRRYYQAGKITSRLANREVLDEFVTMSDQERVVYEAVEDYISTTYNRASAQNRSAVGFVMTVYRKRMTSSFQALKETLGDRLLKMTGPPAARDETDEEDADEDTAFSDEALDADEAADLKKAALKVEEASEISRLLAMVRTLPTDTKVGVLVEQIRSLRSAGYSQAMVFTQYTDTLDFLRRQLSQDKVWRVLCFTGRGGEQQGIDGAWRSVSREDVKRIFHEGGADILLCNEVAAEGLNFQFCGALINYDMPWNPMRVEQRIGRIDRIGQEHPQIRIVNLHYRDSVETDVYIALRQRIGLFGKYVGKLQPILAALPRTLATVTLAPKASQDQQRSLLLSELEAEIKRAEGSGFDLDAITEADLEEPQRPAPLYDLASLDQLLQHCELLPPALDVQPLAINEYQYTGPGLSQSIRLTTSAAYFDEHPESTELWSPGNPTFPAVDAAATPEEVAKMRRDAPLASSPAVNFSDKRPSLLAWLVSSYARRAAGAL